MPAWIYWVAVLISLAAGVSETIFNWNILADIEVPEEWKGWGWLRKLWWAVVTKEAYEPMFYAPLVWVLYGVAINWLLEFKEGFAMRFLSRPASMEKIRAAIREEVREEFDRLVESQERRRSRVRGGGSARRRPEVGTTG